MIAAKARYSRTAAGKIRPYFSLIDIIMVQRNIRCATALIRRALPSGASGLGRCSDA
jgi:hypothetical protein